MLHVFYFISKKPSLSHEAFHAYWRDVHGPIVKRIPQLDRYLQSHQIAGTSIGSSYDGAAEAWVEEEKLTALRESSEYREGALADEPNFIDMARVEWLVTRDRVILDGPQSELQVKAISRVKRREGLRVEEFREHWAEIHGPIASRLPGVERYVQSTTIDEAYAYAEPRWDGVAQIWTKDLETLAAMRSCEAYTAEAMPDAEKFLDTASVAGFAAYEVQVIWPERI